jgi:hypothetical protein
MDLKNLKFMSIRLKNSFWCWNRKAHRRPENFELKPAARPY